MAPTFSIIIPVYNVAPYLAECLDSVRAQTYADWEALCVDDGSTDASAPLLDTYARLDSRIHVTHQRNAGVSSARNRALNTAHGDWICFVDGDDFVKEEWLFHVREVIVAHKEVDAVKMDFFREGVDTAEGLEGRRVLYGDEVVIWGVSHFTSAGYICQMCYRKQRLEGEMFVDGVRMKEDNLFNLRRLFSVNAIMLSDIRDYFYRVREGSAVMKPQTPESGLRLLKEVSSIWQEVQKYYGDRNEVLSLWKEKLFQFLIFDLNDVSLGGWCSVRGVALKYRKELLAFGKCAIPGGIFFSLCAQIFIKTGLVIGFVLRNRALGKIEV